MLKKSVLFVRRSSFVSRISSFASGELHILRDTLHEGRFTGYGFSMADFFSILLKNHRPLCDRAERAVVTHICQELLLEHKNLAADMRRVQVTAIGQRIPLSGVEHVAGRDPDVLGFARLQHHFSFHHKR